MAGKNPFGKTYTIAQFNPGPQTLPSVGPGNRINTPTKKDLTKKRRKKKRKKKDEKDKALEEFLDFLTLAK